MRKAWLLWLLGACGQFGDGGEDPSDAAPPIGAEAGSDAGAPDAAAPPDASTGFCNPAPAGSLLCDDFAEGAKYWIELVSPDDAGQPGILRVRDDEGFVRVTSVPQPGDSGSFALALIGRQPGDVVGEGQSIELSFDLTVNVMGEQLAGLSGFDVGCDTLQIYAQPAGPNATQAPLFLQHTRATRAGCSGTVPVQQSALGPIQVGATVRRGITLSRRAGLLTATPVGIDGGTPLSFAPLPVAQATTVSLGLVPLLPASWNVVFDDALLRRVE